MSVTDPDDIGKLFVGGLSPSTTKESLQNYFSQFGEVVDSVVMIHNETGRSRGFGFIKFKEPNCIFNALQVKNHELDGKRIDPKECTPRSLQKIKKQAGKCKIFLGGLPPDVTENDIRNGMSKYGKVDQVIIMMDQETKKCRGFGFLSFELEESIEQACAERFVTIKDKQVECKKAEPRSKTSQQPTLSRNQNGVIKQAYGQISGFQNNWPVPNQPVFTMQGNGYPNFQSFVNATPASFSSNTPVTFNNAQMLAYGQPIQQNLASPVGSYNYSQASPDSFTQPAFLTNPQALNATPCTAVAQNVLTEAARSYVASGTYSSQSTSSTSYPRYHPYKV